MKLVFGMGGTKVEYFLNMYLITYIMNHCNFSISLLHLLKNRSDGINKISEGGLYCPAL